MSWGGDGHHRSPSLAEPLLPRISGRAPSKADTTSACTRFGALVLTLLFLAGSCLFLPSASGQPLPEEPDRLRMDIAEMSPRLLTTDSTTLTVRGRLTNVGDRRISDLKARVQLGQVRSDERQLAESLAEPPPAELSMSRFTEVVDELAPGESAPLALEVPLNGAADGLEVVRPGVYPLLVNVNGTPEYGGTARLAELNMMLPVLGVPGGSTGSGEYLPDQPRRLSVLWPIAATEPQVVAAPLGGPLVLANDALADALAPGGRLDALVSAADQARDDPRVFGSLCFAVDPDLLQTVEAMAGGYRVRTPRGTIEGTGAAAASRWLDSLRALVDGKCVIQLPFADADLAAVSAIRDSAPGLTATAVGNAATVTRILNVKPVDGVLWPDGRLNDDALEDLSGAGVNTLIVDPDRLPDDTTDGSAPELAGTGIRAQPYDALLARSLTGSGAANTLNPVMEPDIAVQNGLAVLAMRAGLNQRETGSGPVLLAPPHQWTASAAELDTLLQTLGDFAGSGRVEPVQLQELLATRTTGDAGMVRPARDVPTEPSGQVLGRMRDIDAITTDLGRAMSVDATAQVEPAQVLQPLRNGLLRASSSAWRTTQQRDQAMLVAREQLDTLRGRVTAVTPNRPIQLASGSSPLPVLLSSELPVAITVQINLSNAAGLRPEDVPDVVIAANSKVNRRIPAEAQRAGKFNVYVSLSTPGGTELGPPARFELISNEYGVITVIVTATAGGALLLLAGRRIYRRIRAEKRAGASGT
ncbi:DUF6049 family protein [Amycolatopsis cihanbeyliensis]|uniref:Glycoprotein n=1 Tax=Amycolatopsis cihanbeyliensis TaxID=1128664 RepID=A0A542DLK3_AMYCI|nr:DUF6049 family protein [Amycolatopsis cihanbeyliensis]TQJ03845.1 hypothetical protein FB471_3615 [Amycolatopsis cihanbeyliensis]